MMYQIYEAKSVKYDAQQRVGVSVLMLGFVAIPEGIFEIQCIGSRISIQ